MSDATHRLVQGLVDASFAGEHAIKGKSELQKLYRLDAVRRGATRFEFGGEQGPRRAEGAERDAARRFPPSDCQLRPLAARDEHHQAAGSRCANRRASRCAAAA